MRILVIEDDDDIRSICEHMFAWAGHHVAAAVDATRGLELVGSFEPDVIALDLMMPGIDGLTVLAAAPRVGAHLRHPRRDRLLLRTRPRGPAPGVRGRRPTNERDQQAVRPGRASPDPRARVAHVSRGTGRRAAGEDPRARAAGCRLGPERIDLRRCVPSERRGPVESYLEGRRGDPGSNMKIIGLPDAINSIANCAYSRVSARIPRNIRFSHNKD